MEESVRQAFGLEKPNFDTMPVLTLAFIGDAAYELIVRTARAEERKDRGNALNKRVQQFSMARGQSKMAEGLQPLLTEEEASVYRRGKNAHPESVSRHATLKEYLQATGFEALIGYLYLSGRTERAAELIKAGMKYVNGQKI